MTEIQIYLSEALNVEEKRTELSFAWPQGSILGPLLFATLIK